MRGAVNGFKQAIAIMGTVRYDRSNPRPQVLIVGEYLLNFHPGANHDIEDYLESNGLEIIEARMTDVIRKTYFYQDAQAREFHVSQPLATKAFNRVANRLFETAHNVCDGIAKAHPLYEPACRMPELVRESDPIIHHTFDAGEGVLIPAEVLHHAARGCRAFVILQPFGCLPNSCGRTRHRQAAQGTLPRCEHPAARLRPRCQLRQHREPPANAHHEREGAAPARAKRREYQHRTPGVTMARPRKSERDAAGIRLANAFWTLLEHHRLANITVGMVAEQAELNRGTFYYHFKSMDDLIDRAIEDEVLGNESVMQNVFDLIAGSSTVDSLETLINRKTDRFALLINQGGMDLFSVKIKRLVFATWKAILCDDGEELAPNTRLIIEYSTSGIIGIITYGARHETESTSPSSSCRS